MRFAKTYPKSLIGAKAIVARTPMRIDAIPTIAFEDVPA